MATVVGILDRVSWRARTDNIVIADKTTNTLTWVPRGLWCPSLYDSINKAFARGGVERLLTALGELGFPCDHGLVLRRDATERAAAHLSVEVPVKEPLDFWYPLEPRRPMEEGRQVVSFRPPSERLTGERIHQWVGARKGIARKGFGHEDSDLWRIARQQVFLRALLAQQFDFRGVIADKNSMRVYGDPLFELASIDLSWRMQTFEAVRVIMIDGKMRLLKADAPEPTSRRTSASGPRSRKNRRGKTPKASTHVCLRIAKIVFRPLIALVRKIKQLLRGPNRRATKATRPRANWP